MLLYYCSVVPAVGDDVIVSDVAWVAVGGGLDVRSPSVGFEGSGKIYSSAGVRYEVVGLGV